MRADGNRATWVAINVWLVCMIEIVAAKVNSESGSEGKQDQCDLIIYELTLAGLIMFL